MRELYGFSIKTDTVRGIVPRDGHGSEIPTGLNAGYLGSVSNLDKRMGEKTIDGQLIARLYLGEVAVGVVQKGNNPHSAISLVSPYRLDSISLPPSQTVRIGREDLGMPEEVDGYPLNTVSRLCKDGHVMLYKKGDVIHVKDAGSRNGTIQELPHPEKIRNVPLTNGRLRSVGGFESDVLERAVHGEDAHLVLPEYGITAVFDGIGSIRGGGAAARKAAKLLEEMYRKFNPQEIRSQAPEYASIELTASLNVISDIIRKDPSLGETTASVAQMVKHDGKTFAVWANIGDSRIYLRRGGKWYQLTRDDGEGNVLDKALGYDLIDRKHQYGSVEVGRGDMIVCCTDGITGDFGTDRVTRFELEKRIPESRFSPQTVSGVAQGLMDIARKGDDRTVVVTQAIAGEDVYKRQMVCCDRTVFPGENWFSPVIWRV